MKILIGKEIFDKTIFYQSWYTGELFGGKIVEIDDKYSDCSREDFDEDLSFNITKYNERVKKEQEQCVLPSKIKRLEELTKDFAQVQAGLIIDDIEDRKLEFRTLLNEVRVLQGKEPRNAIDSE